MLPPDFTPIENNGMSVITALVLFFIVIGIGWIIKRQDRQSATIKEHSESIHETNIKLTRIEGNVESVKTIVGRIDDSMSDIGKTNQYLIKHILEKQVED